MIECIKFKAYEKGVLLGFADFRLPKMGIEIYGCSVHQKDGRKWVNLPSKEYQSETGEKKYSSYVRFIDADHYKKFIGEALDALKPFFELEQAPKVQERFPDENIPF